MYEKLHLLMQGKSIVSYIDTDVIYPQIKMNPSSVYSFLLVAGYLKVVKAEISFGGDYMCELAKTALRQIQECKYDTEMNARGVKKIYKYGVAFRGKAVEIVKGVD